MRGLTNWLVMLTTDLTSRHPLHAMERGSQALQDENGEKYRRDRIYAVRVFPLILLWLLVLPIYAQGDPTPIAIGETLAVTLSGEGFSLFTHQAEGGEVVTITVRSLHELAQDEPEYVRDTVVDVLNPRGKRLAYNDDHRTDRTDLLPSDSVIEKLLLDEPGMYTIRVNTYGGIFATEVEITLEAADLFDAIVQETDDGIVMTATLPRYLVYSYAFSASAGDVLTITARDLMQTLDPILRLFDSDGNELAVNDDHGTSDTALDVFDARLGDFVVPADGVYRITVSDFRGRAGRFELVITKQ